MGSLPKLKAKINLNYKKAPTSGGCEQCGYVLKDREDWRCIVFGDHDSVRYRVRAGMICDSFNNDRYMKSLRGW